METLRKGLKKGDLFEDGGRIFIIAKVNQDGTYLSELWCPDEKMETAEVPAEAASKASEPVRENLEPEDLKKRSLKYLKDLAEDIGLSASGTKAELIERIAAEEVEIDPETSEEQENEEETASEEETRE